MPPRTSPYDGLGPAERSAISRAAQHTRWSRVRDRHAETAKARAAFLDRFIREARAAAPDAPEEVIRKMADNLKSAYFARLTAKRLGARRRARARA